MNRALKRSVACVMLSVPMSARLFIGMSLDYTESGCAAWMCPLIGLLISAPLILCMQIAAANEEISIFDSICESVPRPFTALLLLPFAVILSIDCAYITRLTANTANINALNSASTPFLVLPVAVVVGIMILLGANAAGKNARIWMVLLPVPLLIIVAVQFRMYEPAWLTPILGGGIRAVIQNGLECAGVISMFSLIWSISVPDGEKRQSFRYTLIAAVVASILLALFQMLAPVRTQVVLSRASRLKMILSNGRVALILQIVMVLVWYGSILQIVSVEASSAARIVEILFPKLKIPIAAAVFALCIGIFASSQLVETEFLRNLELYRFHLIGALMLIVFILICFMRRKSKCVD